MTFNLTFQGHSRSNPMVQLGSPHMTSYLWLIVTMCLTRCLGVTATRNVFPYLLSLGPNFDWWGLTRLIPITSLRQCAWSCDDVVVKFYFKSLVDVCTCCNFTHFSAFCTVMVLLGKAVSTFVQCITFLHHYRSWIQKVDPQTPLTLLGSHQMINIHVRE